MLLCPTGPQVQPTIPLLKSSAFARVYARRVNPKEAQMTMVTLQGQGGSLSVSIPAETQSRLGLEAGQDLTLVDLPDGVQLIKHETALERQTRLAHEVMHEQADALRELAKR